MGRRNAYDSKRLEDMFSIESESKDIFFFCANLLNFFFIFIYSLLVIIEVDDFFLLLLMWKDKRGYSTRRK
jgi:hypothetical protein